MEIVPIGILLALPWVALFSIRQVFKRNPGGSVSADRNRAISCTLFLAASALCWLILDLQPGLPYTLLWVTPVMIPLWVMMIACIFLLLLYAIRHFRDVWLWAQAFAGLAIPIFAFRFFIDEAINLADFYIGYLLFTIVSVLWWGGLVWRMRKRSQRT